MQAAKPIALVTGANRGLGQEVAKQLADLGYTVVLTARSLAKAQAAVQQLPGRDLIAAELDICDAQSVTQLAQWLGAEYAQLDVLVNNAAIHYDT